MLSGQVMEDERCIDRCHLTVYVLNLFTGTTSWAIALASVRALAFETHMKP